MCLIVPTAAHRVYLSFNPYTNFDIGQYNIPHLFTGILLFTLGAIPLALINSRRRWLDLARVVMFIGLSLVLDEWVYLIATDGSDDMYLSAVSWWGSGIMISLACIYVIAIVMVQKRRDSIANGAE